MTVCAKCDEKDAYIAELEQALKGAVWARDEDWIRISTVLGLSPQRAHIIALLYRSPVPLTALNLDQAISVRDDSKERTIKVVHSAICYARRQLGPEFIVTGPSSYGETNVGYMLSKEARETVGKVLDDDGFVKAVTKDNSAMRRLQANAAVRIRKSLASIDKDVALLTE